MTTATVLRKKPSPDTPAVVVAVNPLTAAPIATGTRRRMKAAARWAWVPLLLVLFAGFFTSSAVATFDTGLPTQLAFDCIGGDADYGAKPVATTGLASKSDDRRFWGDDYMTQATPLEWYGAYLPFTSSYTTDGMEKNLKPERCGNVAGPLSTVLPSMIFGIASAITTLILLIYTWATDPTLLDSLMKPIDCIVAGKDSVTPGAGGCQSDGLVNVLFLNYLTPVLGLGALWALWQVIVKRRNSQAMMGALWMVVACALSWVFLVQPTLIATSANGFISGLNNSLMTSIGSVTNVGSDGKAGKSGNICHLDAQPVIPTLHSDGEQYYTNKYTAPREAACVIWKNFIYESWKYGQYGDAVAIDKVTINDGEDREAVPIREGVQKKFGHLDPALVNSLAFAQMDATITDHDEVIDSQTCGPGLGPPGDGKPVSVGGRTHLQPQDGTDGCVYQPLMDYDRFVALRKQVDQDVRMASMAPTWAGDMIGQRYAASTTAVASAALGGIVIIILSFLNVIYQIGMMLLIAVAPLVLLAGLHPGFGKRLTLRWMEALLSTMVKRVVLAFLLALLVSLYGVINQMPLGWLTKVLLIAALGIGIMLYRKQLTQMLSAVSFTGQGGMEEGGAGEKTKRHAQTGVAIGAGAVGGLVASGGNPAGMATGAMRGATMGQRGGFVGRAGMGWRSGKAAGSRNAGSDESANSAPDTPDTQSPPSADAPPATTPRPTGVPNVSGGPTGGGSPDGGTPAAGHAGRTVGVNPAADAAAAGAGQLSPQELDQVKARLASGEGGYKNAFISEEQRLRQNGQWHAPTSPASATQAAQNAHNGIPTSPPTSGTKQG